MIDYAAILTANYPDAQWTLNGDTYDGLTWLSDTPKPSQAELDAAWPATNYKRQKAFTDAKRRAAYAAEADPLFFKVQRGELDEQVWLDKIDEIRVRFPDPEEVN